MLLHAGGRPCDGLVSGLTTRIIGLCCLHRSAGARKGVVTGAGTEAATAQDPDLCRGRHDDRIKIAAVAGWLVTHCACATGLLPEP